ncbi:glycoside hydrolase family 25 domain-containing protein [Prescottella equi]|uniref:hypothetical protein n=1 Tax=Rhodococcus hoagii TaxID=43767 RepID=UPI000D0F4A27|nr:hypothetical protein [Prescottella equi]AVP71347.1 hypothetical protein C7H75_25020 [Prescottella equi]
MADTLWADVSEWQRPVDDSYPYDVLCIRASDGTYRDKNWRKNYDWACRALDSGRLKALIVYFVWRPNWQATVDTVKDMLGAPRAGVSVMLDIETWGGQISGDQSDGINRAYWAFADWFGDKRRVCAYLNPNDAHIWRTRPEGLRYVVPSYGALPRFGPGLDDVRTGMFAHQYTDGQGFGGGLPEGAAPFGNCDMNAANGLDSNQVRELLGLNPAPIPAPQEDDDMAFTEADRAMLVDVFTQLRGPDAKGWAQLGKNEKGEDLSLVDAVAELRKTCGQCCAGKCGGAK